MSNWNLVWLQPKTNSTSIYYNATSPRTFITAGEPSSQNEQKVVENLQRHTKSSAAKRDPLLIKRLNSERFMEQDRHSWGKMEYFQDCMNCMWSKDGAIKGSTKL